MSTHALNPKQFQQLQMFATPEEVGNMRVSHEDDMRVKDLSKWAESRPDAQENMDAVAARSKAAGAAEKPMTVSHSHEEWPGAPVSEFHEAPLALDVDRAVYAYRSRGLLPVEHVEKTVSPPDGAWDRR